MHGNMVRPVAASRMTGVFGHTFATSLRCRAQTYGSPRLHVALNEAGIAVGRHRTARVARNKGPSRRLDLPLFSGEPRCVIFV